MQESVVHYIANQRKGMNHVSELELVLLATNLMESSMILELYVKYSKEGTKIPCLLKTGNKVVEVG
jgi:hypothetical protein